MTSQRIRSDLFLLSLLSLIALPSALHAHVIEGAGLVSGFTHPILGVDHLLAMVGVGIIGARFDGYPLYTVPAVFVMSMTFGIGSGMVAIWPPLVETGVSSSLLVFACMLGLFRNTPIGWAIGAVAFFAFFHGHAHGEELFVVANPLPYFTGLLLATMLLHLVGVAIGILGKRHLIVERVVQLSTIPMGIVGLTLLLPNIQALIG